MSEDSMSDYEDDLDIDKEKKPKKKQVITNIEENN